MPSKEKFAQTLVAASVSSRPDLLTTPEAARFLGVKPSTLITWRCVARYKLPYLKVGRKVLYDQKDLCEWLASRKVRQTEVSA